MLDRDSVLREIRARVREAEARDVRSIIRVAGPPGIGKTAVLRRCADDYAGGIVFVTAEAATGNDAGATLRQLIEQQLEARSVDGSLHDELRHIAATKKLFVIDDVQWLDEHSRRALLGALKPSTAVTLLLADRRLQAPEWPPHETIGLAPLRHASALQLIKSTYSGIAPTVAAELAASAEGVPFVLTLLASDAAARDANDVADANLSVAAVMAARLARLPLAAQDAARLIALTEPPVPLSVLARALGTTVDDLAATLTELRELISLQGSRVEFRHDALRAAVEATVANPVEAYARLLSAYEAEDGSRAAIVRCAVGCGRQDRAATAALELARTLAGAGALNSALQYARIALDNAPPAARTEYAIEYGMVLQMLSRDDEAAILLRTAVRAAIGAHEVSSASELIGALLSVAISLERFAELEGLCRRIEEMPGCPGPISERMASTRRRSLAYAGRFEEFIRLDAEAKQHTWLDARAAAFVHAFSGDFQRAVLELDRYAAGLEHQHARQQTADDLFESAIGFFYRGTSALVRFQTIPAERTRHPSEFAFRALAMVCIGRWDDADNVLDVDRDDDRDEPHQLIEVRLLLAALRGTLGNDSGTLRTLRSMIRQRRIRHAASLARWFVVAKGNEAPPDIGGFVESTLDTAPMPYDLGASPVALAKLASRLGAERCRVAIEQYPAFETPWHRAHREFALGLIERSDERLRRARSAFDELNCPALAMVAGLELPVPRARDVALARRLNLRDGPPSIVPLTKRQRLVAEHASAGATNQEIADALSISVRTVETHLTNIYERLGVTSRGAMSALIHQEAI